MIRDQPYADPSIRGTAAASYAEIMVGIEREVEAGTAYHVARERALANNVPWLRKQYGNAVADQVVKALSHTGPEALSPRTHRVLRQRHVAAVREQVSREGGRIGIVNAIFLRLFGIPLYWPRRR